MNKEYIKERTRNWKWRRVRLNLKISDLAPLVGKTISQISNYENGKVQPRPDTVKKIESFLLLKESSSKDISFIIDE